MTSGGSSRNGSRSRNRNGSSRARYGSGAPSEAKAKGSFTNKAIVLIFAAMFIALIVYGFQYFRQQERTNASISYVTHEVVSDDTLRVWADVTRNRTDDPAYCIVQAWDYSKAEVGRREVAIPTGGDESQRIAIDVPTNHRAVAGGVYGCSGAVPSYLDVSKPDYVKEAADATPAASTSSAAITTSHAKEN